MSASLARIIAIIDADFRIRFRRVSTLVVFLLVSAFAYFWIPAPSSGRALIVINDHRAIYNSGAIGHGTASLGMIFVGLFGFYVISNTIRRDVTTRCGLVAASTPMRSIEYLLGKFIGNLAFLTTFLAGFMLSSMAMLFVRGEAPLQPWVFIEQYLLLTPPAIVFVSVMAVLFESIPRLSGKLGDVLYFFLWVGVIGLVVANEASQSAIKWARCFDFTGFGFMIDQMQHTLHTDSVAIGASPFDPQKTTIAFPGLTLTREWILPRAASLCAPLLLLPIALFFFHRFDPVRVGRFSEKSGHHWIGRVQALCKPISRRGAALLLAPGRKLGSTLLLSLFFCATAVVRALPRGPFPLLSLLGGILFVATTATALGVLTANPKTFIVAFLSFWYLVVNDHGTNQMWDFADFYGGSTPATIIGYAIISVLGILGAQISYRARLARG